MVRTAVLKFQAWAERSLFRPVNVDAGVTLFFFVDDASAQSVQSDNVVVSVSCLSLVKVVHCVLIVFVDNV